MLPLIQADEIKFSIVEYLKATYNFADASKAQAFENLLLNKQHGMFKGPYLQVRLPFKTFSDQVALKECIHIRPNFDPYHHQYLAFQKLSARNGHIPEPVILTTGTGSGKTESFLFPLLDYCYQQQEQRGIKAVILYPMNALATDQARRLAEEIHNFTDEAGNYILRGKIRAGLFIGEGRDKKQRKDRMGTDHIIEDRNTLLKSPPDILLTNFKMLDFSLMQARFNGLWQYNYKNNGLLRYLVLDELHTYDGAKGSDVANLIRRLKLKLNLPKNYLVPVGTSATMAGGEEGKRELVEFFSQIFGVNVEEEAVIEEKRIEPEDFFEIETSVSDFTNKNVEDCVFKENDTYDSYTQRQLTFWGYDSYNAIALGVALKENKYLEELLILLGKSIKKIDEVLTPWAERCDNLESKYSKEEVQLLFNSLLALLSYAKQASGTKEFPFLYIQLSYWMRSLTRILEKTLIHPVYEWENEVNVKDKVLSLPPYFCRECGSSGWIGIKKESAMNFEHDHSRTRQQFMSDNLNKNVYFISSLEDKLYSDVFADDYVPTGDLIQGFLHSHTFQIHDSREENTFKIIGVRRQNGNRIEKVCPHCNNTNTLALVGTGLPTLESIAVAQVLASSTDAALDKDRKLLAFTNGVQDAAHQAGFIENRNYRFGMRHAIQGVLKNLDKAISLQDLFKNFETYWKKNIDPSGTENLEVFYHKFLPPDCDSRVDFKDYRNKDNSFKVSFDQEFSRRMDWEIWSEFSYNAAIGRTLEKSGASAVKFDVQLMETVFDQMEYWLKQNSLGDKISKEGFLKFLNGFLHRMRMRGGVDHPYLRKFRSEKSNYYLITQNTNKSFFMIKNFGKRTRLPKFITLQKGKYTDVFDVVQTATNQNWYSTYFLKSFQMVKKEETEVINDFYLQLIEYLDANRLLDKKVASGITNYGIASDQLFITKKVQGYQCNICEDILHLGEGVERLTEGMACLKYRCGGHYGKLKKSVFDYYRMVYNRGKSLRIFAKDHTGLIDRDKREKLERDFKERSSYKDPNVLVATSTLEMGIDIGDLNVTFNSSLPPETSNYLQRVGRAGRKSGTSLILNIAGRDEHDLYYFQEPQTMMAGIIRTPGCFIGAKDILKRHFMAFCFDSWASNDPENHRIPIMVRILGIKSIPLGDSRFIFNQIANFIDGQKQVLYERFKSQYTTWLPPDSEALIDLEQELLSGFFLNRLTELHGFLLTELKYYEDKRNEINKRIKKMPNTGLETEILKTERRSLSGAIRNINKRNTIEYLTNIGLLPNYAFPETGILLNAQIRHRKVVEGNVSFENEEFGDIVRASSSAITELAPANIFYSQGHKLEAQGLEILSRDEYEEYRFCSNCPEMAKEVDVDKTQNNCPVCSHSSWSSITNKKMLVKLRTVISINDKDKSKITDSRDDRERKFYQKSIHIQTDQKTSKGAWVLKRIPFGIEFFAKTKYLEINTGIREDGFTGPKTIEINGTKYPEVGFVVCKKCGKATERKLNERELNNRTRAYHFPYCSNREHLYKGQPDNYFEEIYLYRQFYTESLKILLPVQDFRTEEKIAVFKAGLYLGMKEYFKGHPDHIRIQDYLEYNKEKRRTERYLVMYETIPGGTGYLSKLFYTEKFNEILNIAYEKIKFCGCKDEGKDGCYHCIYTYGNQYERTKMSRAEAEELFQEITDQSREWKKVDSLKGLEGFANLEESALEHKFIELLKKKFSNTPSWSFEEIIDKRIKRYRLKLVVGNNVIEYEVLPQNLNNYLSGVELKTRPDAVLKCISILKDGKSGTMDEVSAVKDIIIFLDGYLYHATEEYPRVPGDIKKRNSIVNAERYHLWVFTWGDIEIAEKNEKDNLGKLVQEKQIKENLLPKHPLYRGLNLKSIEYSNNFSRFLNLLLSPIEALNFENYAKLILFSCNKKMLGSCYTEETINGFLKNHKVDSMKAESNKPNFFMECDALKFSSEMGISIFIQPATFKAIILSSYDETLSKWDKDNWQLFWEVFNLSQYMGIQSLSQEEIRELNEPENSIDDLLENFDSSLHEIVNVLVNAKISINTEFDFDLMENDEIIASAELGSLERKFVIRPFDEMSKEMFLSKGYIIIPETDFDINNI